MQRTGVKLVKSLFIALALIIASLLPATQFVGVSYADHDNGKGKGNAYGHNDDDHDDDENDDDHDDDDNDDPDDDNDNNDDSDGVVVAASKDTFLREGASNTNEGSNEILRIRHAGPNRALVMFDQSAIATAIDGGTVSSAILKLYIEENGNNWKQSGHPKNPTPQVLNVYRLSQYWEEGNGADDEAKNHRGSGPGATWACAVDTNIRNSKADCTTKWNGGTFASSPTDSTPITNDIDEGWFEFDVTSDVNAFLEGSVVNYGWLVKKNQENLPGMVKFASSEADSHMPKLVLSISGQPANHPPVASDDSVTTNEDTQATFNVLSNDSDPDGDSLTAAIATNPSHGSVTITTAGSATYTPSADYYGPDSFTYTASDGHATDTATVTITINPVNDPPVASDPTVTVGEDGTTTITLPATDIDSSSLTYIIVDLPQHGTLGDDDGDETITYTPTPGFVGEDSFTFKANDGSADSNVATVSITVTELPNENPVAADDSATTDEGEPVTIDVLDNDSDANGDNMDVVSVSDPPQGTAVINVDDTITYTPDGTYSGTDSFTYNIEDGQGGSDSATVTVTINLVNFPPIANDDSPTTNEDTPVTVDVLSNDSDPDEDAISIDSVSTPAYGTAAIVSGGILYTPGSSLQSLPVGQTVIDTFTYTINDGLEDDTATITVTINGVNDAPTANDGLIITDEEELAEYALPASDPDIGDSQTFVIETEPTSGSVSLGPAGSIIYSPDTDFSGSDSFVYSVTDGSGSSDTGTISVTVNPINDPPVAVDDAAPTTSPGVSVTVDVLPNDFDLEGDPLDVISVSTPGHGIAEINGDDTITYTPDLDLIGQDAFTYTISDGNGGTATAQVTVTVNLGEINAIDDLAITEENDEVEIEILDNDIGFDEDPEIPNGDRIALTGEPSNGTVTINADGTVTYEPFDDFVGVDTFVYTIYTPDFTDFDSATVTVTVLPNL